MEDLEYTISQFLATVSTPPKPRNGNLTCSADVLTKTGGPFKQFMNIGMSFFKKAGYMGPDM
jgi:hypothetical protein